MVTSLGDLWCHHKGICGDIMRGIGRVGGGSHPLLERALKAEVVVFGL